MYQRFLVSVILTLLPFTLISAQNLNNNCPSLYTRSKVKTPTINIIKIEVLDSNKYTTLPQFIIKEDSLEKLMMYPEIAKRAGVEGFVVVRVQIDENGKVIKANVIKGIGAGCDDAAVDILQKTKYKNAIISDENFPSEILVTFYFALNLSIDKPDLVLDEIIYEDNSLRSYKKFVFDKFGNASYYEIDKTDEFESDLEIKKFGKINVDTYTRLSDFIISQCFLEYKNYYYGSSTDHERRETVTVKTDTIEKYVRSNGKGDPVGLWAIINLIPYVENQIKWNEDEK